MTRNEDVTWPPPEGAPTWAPLPRGFWARYASFWNETGWYLFNEQAARFDQPIDGPFGSPLDCYDAVEASAKKALEVGHRELLYIHPSARLFEPSVILNGSALVIGAEARIDAFTKIEAGEFCFIGRRVHLASFSHLGIGGGVLIMEDGSCAASHAMILTGSARADALSCSAADPAAVAERSVTVIRRNAAIFAGATVMHGSEIGAGARIGAATLVPKGTVVGGNEVWVAPPAFRRIR